MVVSLNSRLESNKEEEEDVHGGVQGVDNTGYCQLACTTHSFIGCRAGRVVVTPTVSTLDYSTSSWVRQLEPLTTREVV